MDGRYFLQAEAQLQGSGIRLMKMGQPGAPTIEGFLRSSLQPGQTLGFDGRCVDARTGRRYHQLTKQLGAKMNHERDLVGEIWPDRPPLSAQPAWLLEEAYAGLSRRRPPASSLTGWPPRGRRSSSSLPWRTSAGS